MKVLLLVILWLFIIGFIVMLHALRSKIIDFENNCHEAMSRYEQEVSLGCDVTSDDNYEDEKKGGEKVRTIPNTIFMTYRNSFNNIIEVIADSNNFFYAKDHGVTIKNDFYGEPTIQELVVNGTVLISKNGIKKQ